METNTFLPFAFVILSSWLLLLSALLYWKVLRGKKPVLISGEEQIAKAIEELKSGQQSLSTDLKQLTKQHNTLNARSLTFLQKLGFLRFNPFEETGGDQSFSISLLDGNNDGFVLTSLHTRSGTRTYAKEVESGNNKHGFSKEEQKVIKLATKLDTENNMTNLLSSKKFITILTFLGVYLLSSGSSWMVFSYIKGGEGPVDEVVDTGDLDDTRSRINLDLPKTESCPINGAMFTKPEKNIWETKRPITAMIENSADSRPPSGLSRADIVYEAVAEGGITRFMAVLYCGVAAEDVEIAPVRSARVYFINWAQEYGNNPLFVHVGGANNYGGDTAKEVRALEMLEALGWRIRGGNDFDTTFDTGFPVLYRNYERLNHPVATEHTMMASTDEIYKQAEKRGLGATNQNGKAWDTNYVPWKFADGQALASPKATEISFEFWSNKPEYDVSWKYDQSKNVYLGFNGGQPHKDLEYDSVQLSASNVVVQFVREQGPLDVHKHMFYQNVGEGKATIFQNGDVIDGTWKKASAGVRTKFYNKAGTEVELVRGTTWVEAVPTGNTIDY